MSIESVNDTDSVRFTPADLCISNLSTIQTLLDSHQRSFDVSSQSTIQILIGSHQRPLQIESVNDIDSDRFTPAALDVSVCQANRF